MTTFTMQDLTPTKTEQATQLMEANGMTAPTQINNMEVTQEEEEAMQALTEKQQEQLAQHEQAHKIVQGASGFQYTPMDTSPQAQDLSNLFVTLTATMQAIVKLCVESHTKQQPSEGLQEAVDTVLGNAHWFKEMIEEEAEKHITNMDHSYEIESAVESHFSNSFSLDDHVDISSEVESAVENQIADVVEERLADIVRDKLQNLRITFD